MAIRFTLDTNAINAKRKNTALNKLEHLETEGHLVLETTSVTDRELERDQTRLGPLRRDRSAQRSKLTARWVLGVSRLGIDTVLGSEDESNDQDRIAGIVFDEPDASKLGGRARRDVMILHTHLLFGNDAVITTDKRILKARDSLQTEFGIRVFGPEEAVVWVLRTIEET